MTSPPGGLACGQRAIPGAIEHPLNDELLNLCQTKWTSTSDTEEKKLYPWLTNNPPSLTGSQKASKSGISHS